MPSTVPSPVAAALGIVPTVLGGVRRLPGQVIALPIHALSGALNTLDRTRREYDALADRGERLIARLRGIDFDEVEDRVEDALQGTALAAPYDALEDALEDAQENVTALVRKAPGAARSAPARAREAAVSATTSAAAATTQAAGDLASSAADAVQSAADAVAPESGSSSTGAAGPTADQAADAVGAAADTSAEPAPTEEPSAGTADTPAAEAPAAETPAAEAPKGAPTPKATEPDSTRITTAASSEVVQTVEEISAVLGGDVLPHDELPLPDYDHMTLGSLRGRMRSLDVTQLVQIRDYEKAHANRLPIVTMLDNRIAKLATDPSAPLSAGSPSASDPARSTGGAGGSKVDPSTVGPALNPPSQGVPTNPAQPR